MRIDGINISDTGGDRVCLNCKHWQTDVQLKGPANGVICRLTKEHTNPTDTCSQFSPNSTFDSLQDPNKYHDKKHKLNVFKRF
ncbi:hypothetical protein [Methanobrevibacter sp.]|uniref:hypothetical protein n=1 Tax=Methanobrevibacter sp. TaxID=66852 RepID=UPI0025DDA91B|nr:hypothetical protein [Methanobrevibacter sp.]MBQ2666036.1 hypothetical protein [Methanobrevibacter sp.]